MVPNLFSVSVPGSLMLLGEHAVLAGKPAIVCAVNKRLRVQLIPDTSSNIKISDKNLGDLELPLTQLEIIAPFKFVLSAILLFKPRIKTGFTLKIDADFSSVMGLGSSAAVTAATVAVLGQWLDTKPLPTHKIFILAKQAILTVQGSGSGADLAASIYGGVVNYQIAPFRATQLPLIPNLTAVYCGYKKPTPEVLAIVNAAKQQQPQLFASIFHAMQVCVQQAIVAIKTANWPALGKLFMHHQGLQAAIGTSNNLLDTLISQLTACPEIFGAKISGSGLGDCVIGLGELPSNIFPQDLAQQQQGIVQIPITIDPRGLQYASD